jgi:hypothetical protein
VVRILDGPLFAKDQLPPIPRDSVTFAVASLDPARAFETLESGLKALEPQLLEQLTGIEKSLEQTAGVKLRDDLLKRLGPTWALVRTSPQAVNAAQQREPGANDYALLARVPDPAGFEQVLERIAARVNQYFREAYKVPGGKDDDPPILALERLPAPDRGFQLTSPAKMVLWLNEDRATILVGKSFVSCALGLEPARRALAGESNAESGLKPEGELRQAVDCLPERLIFLAVVDDRDSPLPEEIAGLPAHAQYYASIAGLEVQPDGGASSSVLSILGIPRPGGFRVRVPRSKVPTIEQLRAHVFPSVVAATADDRGLRVFTREALPFLGVGDAISFKSKVSWDGMKGFKRDVKFSVNLGFSR